MQLICQCVLRKVVILFRRDRVKIVGGSTIIRLLVELDGRLCICSKGGGGLVLSMCHKDIGGLNSLMKELRTHEEAF